VWGLHSLMYSAKRKLSSALSFTYCEVLFIEGLWLRQIADTCDPVTSKRIKVWAAFNAMKQMLLAHLASERAKRELELGASPSSPTKKSGWELGNGDSGDGKPEAAQAAMPTEEQNTSRHVAKLGEELHNVNGEIADLRRSLEENFLAMQTMLEQRLDTFFKLPNVTSLFSNKKSLRGKTSPVRRPSQRAKSPGGERLRIE